MYIAPNFQPSPRASYCIFSPIAIIHSPIRLKLSRYNVTAPPRLTSIALSHQCGTSRQLMVSPAHKVISARRKILPEILLSRRKFLMVSPNCGCLNSQRRNFGEERKLRIVARIKKGTVGRTGRNTPSTPSPIQVYAAAAVRYLIMGREIFVITEDRDTCQRRGNCNRPGEISTAGCQEQVYSKRILPETEYRYMKASAFASK